MVGTLLNAKWLKEVYMKYSNDLPTLFTSIFDEFVADANTAN
jgi:hypothetical protein